MRRFTVPFNIDNEDKIIGGYISLRQFFWLFLSLMFVLYLFVINTGYLIKTNLGGGDIQIKINHFQLIIRLILSIISVVISLLLSFLNLADISSDKYLIKLIKFKFRKHILIN